jgi:hypothetical protein
MINCVFAIYDQAAKAYMSPFSFQSPGQAIRAFTDLANDQNTNVGKHPEDYSLFQIGSFDDEKGLLKDMKHVNLGKAIEFVSSFTGSEMISADTDKDIRNGASLGNVP